MQLDGNCRDQVKTPIHFGKLLTKFTTGFGYVEKVEETSKFGTPSESVKSKRVPLWSICTRFGVCEDFTQSRIWQISVHNFLGSIGCWSNCPSRQCQGSNGSDYDWESAVYLKRIKSLFVQLKSAAIQFPILSKYGWKNMF